MESARIDGDLDVRVSSLHPNRRLPSQQSNPPSGLLSFWRRGRILQPSLAHRAVSIPNLQIIIRVTRTSWRVKIRGGWVIRSFNMNRNSERIFKGDMDAESASLCKTWSQHCFPKP